MLEWYSVCWMASSAQFWWKCYYRYHFNSFYIIVKRERKTFMHRTRIVANEENLHTSTQHKTVLLRGVSIVWGFPQRKQQQKMLDIICQTYIWMNASRPEIGKKYERDEGKGWRIEMKMQRTREKWFDFLVFSTNMENWNAKTHTESGNAIFCKITFKSDQWCYFRLIWAHWTNTTQRVDSLLCMHIWSWLLYYCFHPCDGQTINALFFFSFFAIYRCRWIRQKYNR